MIDKTWLIVVTFLMVPLVPALILLVSPALAGIAAVVAVLLMGLASTLMIAG